MEDQELICRALYDLNLTQQSIISALEDMAALVEKMDYLPPEIVDSLRRHLDTVARNSDRSLDSMYLLPSIKALPR
ncbi:hypothetical protein AO391_05255 [Pseudomonas marginalis ICMP 9505]|uniref:Uncharacterized protein n=1 Tax=Pseudomonas kitaguniensis TaxID=2607908 RepID=A0A5N7JMV4_9PSED|nr:hypothetical protein [Pseudomonas kitaguniensis]KTC18544.1 hypothetical protein AO391_05255 [Pseudomonas marginalis ICMP 9505]MPQ82728.1 hypothetical protein [Pseudomonas kitaguniensis]